MAINVTKFMVSNDQRSIELDMNVDSGTFTSIGLWNDQTYNNPENLEDFSSLLSGLSNTESIVLDPAALAGTLNQAKDLTGIYFMRIVASNGDKIIVATVNLTQWYIFQARLIANIDLSCLGCNSNFQNALLLDLYVEAVKSSLLIGRYHDAITHLRKLRLTTDTNDCDECNDIEPLISTAGNIVSVGVLDCVLTVA